MSTTGLFLTSACDFVLVEHQLISLDNCRGSPDSPGGMEHRSMVLISASLRQLLQHVYFSSPTFFSNLQRELQLPAAVANHLCNEQPDSTGNQAGQPLRAYTDWEPVRVGSDLKQQLDDFLEQALRGG
eukprot:gnl/MRDRNA2_/MRDRNA2_205961_c0_seq1.p1 gnl/MRDRNA2_/MRDRNA2_205961_c0~~gnl/MRDRNA2_/MRDRNA2_205961_c0_seq1.p1  ORF type:complete len:128 (-),score=22.61 gnl/MRDRNA2_/MRDRNA2_205961_c0_seq1:137-520(-)